MSPDRIPEPPVRAFPPHNRAVFAVTIVRAAVCGPERRCWRRRRGECDDAGHASVRLRRNRKEGT